MRANLTIKSAKNLPKLGLTTNPSTYMYIYIKQSILQNGTKQDITSIYPNSCNPTWNYNTEILAQNQLNIITFYLYNSNPNDVDQLLAYGSIQFQIFLTKTVTNSRVMLQDALGNYLSSYIEIQHCNAKPASNLIPESNQSTTIRINLLNITTSNQHSQSWLSSFKSKHITIKYGSQSRQLNQNIPVTTLKYQNINDIQVILELAKDQQDNQANRILMKGIISYQNIQQNTSCRVRMFYHNYQAIIIMCVSIIPNGLLVKNYNTLLVEVTNLIIEPIKKVPKDWTLSLFSVFTIENINKIKQPVRLYIENNTNLQFQFFQEKIDNNTILDVQPLASHAISVNSINWSKTLNSQQNIKMYNPARGIVINIDINFTVIKNENDPILQPKFQQPNLQNFSDKGKFKISEIKMFGACFNQIFTQKTTFRFVYIPKYSTNKIIFPSFQLKNSIEYSIPCCQAVNQTKDGGTLCLVTFDHFFGNQQSSKNQFQDYIIFKINCKGLQNLQLAQVIFHDSFLSFAKKRTLVKPNKNFQIMVKDRALKIKVIGRMYPLFSPGFLTIRNCILHGGFNRINLSLAFDSNQLSLEGQWGNYLMSKPYTLQLNNNGIQFKITSPLINKQVHYQFEQIFGIPDPLKKYTATISFAQEIKLIIFYNYSINQKYQKPDQILEPSLFTAVTPIHLKAKSIYLNFIGFKQFFLRVTKGGTTYETLKQNPSNSLIRFRNCQDMYFGKQAQNQYIFFYLYCKNKDNELIIFAGHYNVKHIIGKGQYQIILYQMGSPQMAKNYTVLTFVILNNQPLTYNVISFSPKSLQFMPKQYFKSILKYYLVGQIKNNPTGIIQLTTTKNNDNLIAKDSVIIKNGESVVWRLYSSTKTLSKQSFWSADKEIVGIGSMSWVYLKANGLFQMKFLMSKDLINKFSPNKLALLQNSVKIVLEYACQPIKIVEIQAKNRNPKPIQIDLLHSAAVKINILQIIPQCSHQKILEIALLPFQYQFCSQSSFTPNKQFVLQIENMQTKITAIKGSKNKQKYNKQSKQKIINFRGRRIETMQKIGFIMDINEICLIKADAIFISSKFTNNPKGIVTLNNLYSDNLKIKQIQIYGIQNQKQIKNIGKLSAVKINLEKNKFNQIKSSFITNEITFCLYFILTLQDKRKLKTIVYLIDIPIDKLDDKPFHYEWIINSQDKNNQMSLLTIEGTYFYNKIQQIETHLVSYYMQKNNIIQQTKIQINNKSKLDLSQKIIKIPVFRPDRKRGYRILATLPDSLNANSISVIVQQGNKIVNLKKVEHNGKLYVCNSDKNIKVKQLIINSNEVNRIQQLEQKNFTRRFLINRNPNQIVKLLQQPYAIADCKPQTIVIKFWFHSIFSNQTKTKILWMSNNKNDQILTRHFGLLIKHGKQKQLIRPIDQRGQLQNDGSLSFEQRCVSFGFDPFADQLEIFLYIHHVLNQKQIANQLDCEKLQNWTKLFPVAYGRINLQKINQNVFIGCQLQKIENFNTTLDKSLNKIIIRPNLNCLGSITMQRLKWGFIQLQLQQLSGLQLQFRSENTLVYFTLQIENSKRVRLAGITTQARKFAKVQKIKFLNRKFKYFYMQQIGQIQNLKITANLLTFNNQFKLFQKRVDISQFLQQPGTHPITAQIKPAQTKGLKNILQMKILMNNKSEWTQQINIVQQAKKVNTIDLVTFQGVQQKQLILRLLKCQQPSHFIQVLNQVKESIIYSKQAQQDLLRACGYYLQFQNDTKVISILLQMINIQLFKYPKTIEQLKQEQITKIYGYLKILFYSNQLVKQNIQKKISSSDYDKLSQKFANASLLDQNIKVQKKRLYNLQQMYAASSLAHIQHIFPILSILLSNSKIFKHLFYRDIKEWVQNIMFKQDAIFLQFIQILEQLRQDKELELGNQLTEDVLKIGLKKSIPMSPLIQLWAKLSKQTITQYSKQVFTKILQKLPITKQSQEGVKNFRTFINYLQLFYIDIPPQCWSKVVQNILQLIKSSKQLYSINIYGQLLIKINSLNKINQDLKISANGELKRILTVQNDKNIKVCLNNIIDKFCGKKIHTTHESTAQKNQFYKKYLITS